MPDGTYRFGVLGPLIAERDGQALPVPTGSQRVVLAMLLMARGAPVSRDQLMDELWGESPPATAHSALHVHLSKLRTLLGDPITLGPAGYSLASGLVLDVAEFEALVEGARGDPAQARVLLRQALKMFRGDPLGDVPDQRLLGQWRRELVEKRLAALMARIDADLAAGAGAELTVELERLVAEHPFEERLWGQLMRATYQAGKRTEALDIYQRARRLLAEELGLDPGEGLSRLQQRILEEDPTLLAQPAPAAVVQRAARSDIPVAPTRLVGREPELEALGQMLEDRDVRLLTVTGSGGVGKTRLALEVARSQEGRFSHGAVFVRLDRVADPLEVGSEIAAAISRRDGASRLGPEGLLNYLRDREILLVLDNFEHLLPAASEIATLAAQAPGMRVLITSRAPLRIRGEHVFDLGPLGLPRGDRDSAEAPAVSLFVQCGLAVDRRLGLDDATIATIGRICTALDGLPLAIELAASRLHTLSIDDIAERLARPLSVGEYGIRDLPARHQTLQHTIRWSYDLLGPETQAVLRAAAVFSGGFTLGALDAVAGRPCGTDADHLLEASLLRRDPGTNRFILLALVRAFAFDELTHESELEAARARHRQYFATLADPVTVEFDRQWFPGDLAVILYPEHANLREALRDAISVGDEDSALRLGLAMRAIWMGDLSFHEAQDLVESLFARFSLRPADELLLLRTMSALEAQGSYTSQWTDRLTARAVALGDHEAEMKGVMNLFALLANQENVTAIAGLRPRLEELLATEPVARHRFGLNHSLANAAYVAEEFDVAAAYNAACIAYAAEARDPFLIAGSALDSLLIDLAREDRIDPDQLAEALRLVTETAFLLFHVYALWVVGRFAVDIDPEVAGRCLAHAEQLIAEHDIRLWPESTLRDEALTRLSVDDFALLVEGISPMTHVEALAEASAWLSALTGPGATGSEGAPGRPDSG